MRRFIIAAAVCALAGIGSAAAQDAREKEIRSVSDSFVAAWNKHDAKAMAALWAPEGDLINPFGRAATGRAEVEKLFSDEHTTFMKASTYSLANYKVRFASPAIAVVDYDGEVVGVLGADGSAAPPFKHHVSAVYVKKGGHWWMFSARATAFLPSPGAPPAAAKPAAPVKKK